MAYFIFFKSLRSLGEFRKIPHVKIPPKSPCANFQSLAIFKKLNFIRKRIFPVTFGPSGLSAQSLLFLLANFPSPSHWASAFQPAQPTRTAHPITVLLPPAPKPGAHGGAAGRPRAASPVAPTPPPDEKNGRI
jgi:hypothetical protein